MSHLDLFVNPHNAARAASSALALRLRCGRFLVVLRIGSCGSRRRALL